MGNFKTVEEAKAFLKEKGYQTDNLWCINDVQANYKCSEEVAQKILIEALTNSATMEQIWFAINFHAEDKGLIKTQ